MRNTNLQTGKPIIGIPTIDTGGIDEFVLFSKYSTEAVSPTFLVGQHPIVIKAYGLQAGESVVLYNYHTPSGSMDEYTYRGESVILTPDNTTAIASITGAYRLKFIGTALGSLYVTATTLNKNWGRESSSDTYLRSQAARPNVLIDVGTPGGVSATVQVLSEPWAFRAYHLDSSSYIETVNVFQKDGVDYIEAASSENRTYKLTDKNTTLVLDIAGKYRFRLVGTNPNALLVGNENPISYIDPYTITGETGPQGPPGGGITIVDTPTDGDILEYTTAASGWVPKKDPRDIYLDGGNF